jgi:hypothetical protein
MSYQVVFDEQLKIVRVRLSGSIPHKEHEAARREAARLCREHGCRKLLVDLVDLTTDKDVSTMTIFDFGTGYQKAGLEIGTYIGHVMPTNPKAMEDVDFTTTVALNRGGFIIRNFKTIQEAENWLLEQ